MSEDPHWCEQSSYEGKFCIFTTLILGTNILAIIKSWQRVHCALPTQRTNRNGEQGNHCCKVYYNLLLYIDLGSTNYDCSSLYLLIQEGFLQCQILTSSIKLKDEGWRIVSEG